MNFLPGSSFVKVLQLRDLLKSFFRRASLPSGKSWLLWVLWLISLQPCRFQTKKSSITATKTNTPKFHGFSFLWWGKNLHISVWLKIQSYVISCCSYVRVYVLNIMFQVNSLAVIPSTPLCFISYKLASY